MVVVISDGIRIGIEELKGQCHHDDGASRRERSPQCGKLHFRHGAHG